MSPDVAQTFDLDEAERRQLVRMDSGKVNIAPPLDDARWFRLVGVRLGNASDLYPKGDEVQTVEPWQPPDVWADLTKTMINQILNDLDQGLGDVERYSDAPRATDRAAWPVVIKHAGSKTEKQARSIIKAWTKSGLLISKDYDSPTARKTVKGLYVVDAKRPS